jgi:hypothetical protein
MSRRAREEGAREKERKSVQAIPRVQVQVARGTTAVVYGDVEYKGHTGRRESGYCETGGRRLWEASEMRRYTLEDTQDRRAIRDSMLARHMHLASRYYR